MSRVSVVVPTYNRAELLKEALESIRSQTLPPLEVVVVDDGSTDHTAHICAALGQSIRYIRQDNGGPAAARNTGIRDARGEWIAFCDSDDVWVADKLAVQMEALACTGTGWSLSDFSLIGPDGKALPGGERGFERSFATLAESGTSAEEHLGEWLVRGQVPSAPEPIVIYTGDAYGMLFLGNVANVTSAIVARDVIARVGMFDESYRVAEETEFFHRVSSQFEVTVVMQRLCKYRVGQPSIISGDQEPLIRNAIRSLEQAVTLRQGLTEKERKALREGRQRLHARLAYAQLAALDRKGARQALAQNIKDQLFRPKSAAIFLLSLLPVEALRGLHRIKRALGAFGR